MADTKAVMRAGAEVYVALAKARFDKASIMVLARHVQGGTKFGDLPADVKVPLLRMAGALFPDVLGDAPKAPETPAAPPPSEDKVETAEAEVVIPAPASE